MNAEWHRRERQQKQLKKAEREHVVALEEYNIINQILSGNEMTEAILREWTHGECLSCFIFGTYFCPAESFYPL